MIDQLVGLRLVHDLVQHAPSLGEIAVGLASFSERALQLFNHYNHDGVDGSISNYCFQCIERVPQVSAHSADEIVGLTACLSRKVISPSASFCMNVCI